MNQYKQNRENAENKKKVDLSLFTKVVTKTEEVGGVNNVKNNSDDSNKYDAIKKLAEIQNQKLKEAEEKMKKRKNIDEIIKRVYVNIEDKKEFDKDLEEARREMKKQEEIKQQKIKEIEQMMEKKKLEEKKKVDNFVEEFNKNKNAMVNNKFLNDNNKEVKEVGIEIKMNNLSHTNYINTNLSDNFNFSDAHHFNNFTLKIELNEDKSPIQSNSNNIQLPSNLNSNYDQLITNLIQNREKILNVSSSFNLHNNTITQNNINITDCNAGKNLELDQVLKNKISKLSDKDFKKISTTNNNTKNSNSFIKTDNNNKPDSHKNKNLLKEGLHNNHQNRKNKKRELITQVNRHVMRSFHSVTEKELSQFQKYYNEKLNIPNNEAEEQKEKIKTIKNQEETTSTANNPTPASATFTPRIIINLESDSYNTKNKNAEDKFSKFLEDYENKDKNKINIENNNIENVRSDKLLKFDLIDSLNIPNFKIPELLANNVNPFMDYISEKNRINNISEDFKKADVAPSTIYMLQTSSNSESKKENSDISNESGSSNNLQTLRENLLESQLAELQSVFPNYEKEREEIIKQEDLNRIDQVYNRNFNKLNKIKTDEYLTNLISLMDKQIK